MTDVSIQPPAPPAQAPTIEPGGRHPMRHMAMIGISILVTAAVVGGAVYAWSALEQDRVTREAEETISMLENANAALEEQVMDYKEQEEEQAMEAQEEAVTPQPDVTFLDDQAAGTIRVFDHGQEVGVIDVPDTLPFFSVGIFEQINTDVYIQVDPDGLGGYILYGGAFNLYKYDAVAGTIAPVPFAGAWATDISPDGTQLAYVSEQRVVVKQLATGEERGFDVAETYGQFGDMLFSPNGARLAYAASVANPPDESGAVFVIDLATGEQTVAFETLSPPQIIGWRDNQTPEYTE